MKYSVQLTIILLTLFCSRVLLGQTPLVNYVDKLKMFPYNAQKEVIVNEKITNFQIRVVQYSENWILIMNDSIDYNVLLINKIMSISRVSDFCEDAIIRVFCNNQLSILNKPYLLGDIQMSSTYIFDEKATEELNIIFSWENPLTALVVLPPKIVTSAKQSMFSRVFSMFKKE